MKSWIRYLAGKVVRLSTLLIAVCVISFALVSMSPVDPVQSYIGADMMRVSPEQRQAIAVYWGLDKSPIEQFSRWATAMAHGDMGTSMIYREPVAEVIKERFLSSLALMAGAWIISGMIGFTFGIIAALKRDSWLDRIISWYCYTLASTPTFWLGLLLLMVFAVWLGWFPVGLGVPAGVLATDVTLGDQLWHMLLPMITLSVIGIAPIGLHTRQKMIDVLESEYVLFARARGESTSRILFHHGIRNIALPALTLQFASFSELFGGAVLTEQVFSYPGLGQATIEAGLRGDVPLLLGVVIFSTVFVFTGNMIADILYKLIDPRMREG